MKYSPPKFGVASGGKEWEQRWDGVKEREWRKWWGKKPSVVLSKQGIKSCHVYF